MNFESNVTNAAGAILSGSEVNSSISVQNRKNSYNNSSFQDELSSAAKDESSEVKETEDANSTDKAAENKACEKADKKAVKGNSKGKKPEVQKSEQNSQNQLTGGVTVDAAQNGDAYAMLSDQMKNYVLKNGTQFNINNNLMTANTRAEISSVQPKVDYTSIQMSDSDAMFFLNLVKNTDMSMQSIASEFQKTLARGQVQQAQSTAKASAALIAALQESSKTNQPFRIDFDKDVSVILKVDKEGKINANFIPGDKAVEAYLRNNIDFLRQRFNEENIAYGDLNYSKSRQEKQEQEQRNKKRSDSDE